MKVRAMGAGAGSIWVLALVTAIIFYIAYPKWVLDEFHWIGNSIVMGFLTYGFAMFGCYARANNDLEGPGTAATVLTLTIIIPFILLVPGYDDFGQDIADKSMWIVFALSVLHGLVIWLILRSEEEHIQRTFHRG